jgi:CBS domain-containing protein
MKTTTRTLRALTAADLMSPDVVTLNRRASLRFAARLLRRADVTGAPVVDERGRCVGVLSAVDFLRYAEGESAREGPHALQTCRYQERGSLPDGPGAVVCTLADGACPLQDERPTTAGRHINLCRLPNATLCDWQQTYEGGAPDEVGAYMTRDVVTVGPGERVTELARKMIDAHIHRVVVTDEQGRPVGVVSATDVLAAVAREGLV